MGTAELSQPTETQYSTLPIVEQQDPMIFDLPSTSVILAEPTVPLDENILELLGETPLKKKCYSSPIQSELAVRWERTYYCNQQALVISCIGQALTKMFASTNKDAEVIKLIIDGARLLCDSQYTESTSRRSFVASTIKKDIKDQLYITEIDSKTAKAINKSGSEIKTAPQKSPAFSQPKFNQARRPLNVQTPLPLARQAGSGRRSTPVIQQPRRYAQPPPPPQPEMRYHPPPLAPPQRSRGRMRTRRSRRYVMPPAGYLYFTTDGVLLPMII